MVTNMKLKFAQGAKILSLNVLKAFTVMFCDKEKYLEVKVSRPLGKMAAEK